MSKLYIVPTPIGNLDDMTYRGVNILLSADLILAEDTRNTGILLKYYAIDKPMKPYHAFNEHKVVNQLTGRIARGETMALVSDSGTPGISDPGFLIAKNCIEQGLEVETLPGPVAFIPALVNSGLPCNRFVFEGFLPHKKGRQKRLKELSQESRTMVFYESPYRLEKAIQEFIEYFGDERQMSVTREVTKIYEENIRGTAREILQYVNNNTIKGEIVIIVEGTPKK